MGGGNRGHRSASHNHARECSWQDANHRDAPSGNAVKYGNGELETIERLVDIGHYEVQVTPENCAATLISVDQIVEDGHSVTFSKTQMIIMEEEGCYRL